MKKFMDLLPGDDKKESLESKKPRQGPRVVGSQLRRNYMGG